MQYKVKFGLFGGTARMLDHDDMGVVIEKERDVVCVYGTDGEYERIFCAVPLCHPRQLRGAEYIVDFSPSKYAKITVGDLCIVIDYEKRICTNNKALLCYGSEYWGEDVSVPWSDVQY